MAFWKNTKGKKENILLGLGVGENTFGSPFSVADNESRYSRNLSSDMYPALSVRKARGTYGATLGKCMALGERNNQSIQSHQCVAGTDGVFSTAIKTATATAKRELDMFSTATTLFYVYIETISSYRQVVLSYMPINGGTLTTVQLTSDNYDKYYPKIIVSGSTIYYMYTGKSATSTYKQIFTATSNLTGGSFSTTQRTSSNYNKLEVDFCIGTGYLYYVWTEDDPTTYYGLWHGVLATGGTGWAATKLVVLANPSKINIEISSTTLYYSFIESGITIFTATSALDGSTYASADRFTGVLSGLDMKINGTTIYYMFINAGYSTIPQIYTAKMEVGGTGWVHKEQTFSYEAKYECRMSISTFTDATVRIHGVYRDEDTQVYSCMWNTTNDGFASVLRSDLQTIDRVYPVVFGNQNRMNVAWLWNQQDVDGNATTTYQLEAGYIDFYDCQLMYRSDVYPTWNMIKECMHDSPGRFRDFTTGTTKYTLYMNTTQRLAYTYTDAGKTITDLTNAPYTNIFTVHAGRIYAAVDSDIKFSALNLINDWSTVNDAGSISVTNAKGTLSAITTYNGYVVSWTEYSMHILYGTSPTSFELREVDGGVGCISDRSVVECNGVLYWAAYDGFYSYSGGVVTKISSKVDAYFNDMNTYYTSYGKGISAGVISKRIYLSIPYNGDSYAEGNTLLLMYDTSTGNWYPQTSGFTDFVLIGEVLFGVDTNHKIWTMEHKTNTNDGGTEITWSWISAPIQKNKVKERKTLTEVWLTVNLPVGSTLNISTSSSVDGNDFVLSKTITASANEKVERILIPYNQVYASSFFRIKLDGTGRSEVYNMEQHYRVW